MILSGKIDDPAEAFQKTYHHKQNQATLLRAAVRQNRATKEERRLLAKLDAELENFERKKRFLVDRDFGPSVGKIQDMEESAKFFSQFTAVSFFVITTASLLFVLNYFIHLSVDVLPLVVPATLIFLGWIWFSERDWLLHRAGRHWSEMAKDLRESLSKKKDKDEK